MFYVFCGMILSCQNHSNAMCKVTIHSGYFTHLIDSVINMDKHCFYYNDSLSYSIRSRNFLNSENDTCYFLEFEAKDNIAYFENYNVDKDTMYFIEFKKHLLFIRGETSFLSEFTFITSEIEVKKNNLNKNDFFIQNDLDLDSIHYQQEIFIQDSKINIIDEDDSWAIRSFIIFEGKYYYHDSRNLYRCYK